MTEGWYCIRERLPQADDADGNGHVLAWHSFQHGILFAWDGVTRCRFITHWMPIRAFDGAWTDTRQKTPTAEDADAMNCVLAWHATEGAVITGYFQIPGRDEYTLFARLPDAPGEKKTT